MNRLGSFVVTVVVALLAFFCITYIVLEVFNQRQMFVKVPKGSVQFRIDSDFSLTEIEKVRVAIRKWEVASNGCLKVPFYISSIPLSDIARWSGDSLPTIYDASSFFNWKRYLASQLCLTPCLGVTQIYTGDIFILESGNELFETVVLHEIGHVLLGGLHSDSKEDLMYPTVTGPKGISPREMMSLQLLYCNFTNK